MSAMLACVALVISLPLLASSCNRNNGRPLIFNFGDSNSDTGGLSAAIGFDIGYPYGRAFFHPPTGRASDGRLIIDFLCFVNPLMACCGHGGAPYNFDSDATSCLGSGYTVCQEKIPYISWDGTHYTEAANAIFASKILSTRYSSPPLPFNFFCSTSNATIC